MLKRQEDGCSQTCQQVAPHFFPPPPLKKTSTLTLTWCRRVCTLPRLALASSRTVPACRERVLRRRATEIQQEVECMLTRFG